MLTRILVPALTTVLVAACFPPKTLVSDTRMAHAPSREPGCKLEMIDDLMRDPLTFHSRWQILGMITVVSEETDPTSEAVRAQVRPRACAMGGTAVGMLAASAGAQIGIVQQKSNASYMVVRPKALAETPSTF